MKYYTVNMFWSSNLLEVCREPGLHTHIQSKHLKIKELASSHSSKRTRKPGWLAHHTSKGGVFCGSFKRCVGACVSRSSDEIIVNKNALAVRTSVSLRINDVFVSQAI
jgi:hypothetical protein